MQLWKTLEYSSITSMPGLWICSSCTRFWICLDNALWQGSEYVWPTFYRVLNKHPVLNMPRLRILQECEYARVTQGAKYAWISLNNFSMCQMQYRAQDHCTNYQTVIKTERYSEHCQTSKMQHFAKRQGDFETRTIR